MSIVTNVKFDTADIKAREFAPKPPVVESTEIILTNGVIVRTLGTPFELAEDWRNAHEAGRLFLIFVDGKAIYLNPDHVIGVQNPFSEGREGGYA